MMFRSPSLLQVDWQRKGGTYWVRYIHVELLPMTTSTTGAAAGPEVHFTLDQVSETTET